MNPSTRTKLLVTLFGAQVCGSTAHSMSMAVGSIMAAGIAGTNTASGLAVGMAALGAALGSWRSRARWPARADVRAWPSATRSAASAPSSP